MKFIGVDIGKSGGLVALNLEGVVIECIKTPESPIDVFKFFERHSDAKFCVIEKVHAMPGQGVTSMFSFGKTAGHIEMALLGNRIPFEEIHPTKWQKFFSLGTSNSNKTEWKNKLKNFAIKLFPKEKVTLYNADALLIAEYCRRNHK